MNNPIKPKRQEKRRVRQRRLPDVSYLWACFDGYSLADVRKSMRQLCEDDELWKLVEEILRVFRIPDALAGLVQESARLGGGDATEGETMTPTTEQPQKLVQSLTVCQICHQGLAIAALSIPIVGETPKEQADRALRSLQQHIKDRHPEHAIAVKTITTTFTRLFQDLLLLQTYATEDPVLFAAGEAARANIHAMTRKNRLTDEQLQKLITEKLSLNPFMNASQVKQASIAAMPIARWLRDFLSEEGAFEHPQVKQAREQAPPVRTA